MTDEEIAKICPPWCDVWEFIRMVQKALQEVFEPLLDYFNNLFETIENKIVLKPVPDYKFRQQDKLIKYHYIPNYKARMMCVGKKGNYRRF